MANVKSIRALERGLEVIENVREGGGVTLNDLYIRTGLPRATLLRVLKTLEQRECCRAVTYKSVPSSVLVGKVDGDMTTRERHQQI